MTQRTARKFSPIFVATVTPASIETKKASNGDEYLICRSATFSRPGHEPEARTLMAFGQSAQSVRDLLNAGTPVELAVQFNGGTVKMIGAPRPAQAKAADAVVSAKPRRMSKAMLQACVEASGYDQNDRYDVAA